MTDQAYQSENCPEISEVRFGMNAQERKQFEVFGFIIRRGLFSAEEMKQLSDEFDRGCAEAFEDSPFDGTIEKGANFTRLGTPFFRSLPSDERLYAVARHAYGEDVIGHHFGGNLKVGDSGWHVDTHSYHQFGLKVAVYPDPADAETGALRIIPGSHQEPLFSAAREVVREMEIWDVPAFVCPSEPGDVIFFDLRCWHASSGGATGRRMAGNVYYNNPKTPDEEQATRAQYDRSRKSSVTWAMDRGEEPQYPDPHWHLDTEGDPIRHRWVERMRELGWFDLDNEKYLKELQSQL